LTEKGRKEKESKWTNKKWVFVFRN